jgi:hypothetical protein
LAEAGKQNQERHRVRAKRLLVSVRNICEVVSGMAKPSDACRRGLPVWRKGRRTGLKIFKIALSDHFSRLLLTRVSAFIYKPIFNFSLISPHP